MDLISDPKSKKLYDKCKYRVKLWEHDFKKAHGRVPSKLDIREAENDVRLAYKTYFKLKSAALDQCFMNIDGFQSDEECINEQYADLSSTESHPVDVNTTNIILSPSFTTETLTVEECKLPKLKDNASESGIWGKHLNNTKPEAKAKEVEININLNFTQKLFDGSKSSRRNPRKSLSFHCRKNKTNTEERKSLSQPTETLFCLETHSPFQESLQNISSSSTDMVNLKTISKTCVNTQPVNMIDSVIKNNYKPRRTLDVGWMERTTKISGVLERSDLNGENFIISENYVKDTSSMMKCDYDSDDIIENSDEEDLSKSISNVVKKIQNGDSKLNENKLRENEKELRSILQNSNCTSVNELQKNVQIETEIDVNEKENDVKSENKKAVQNSVSSNIQSGTSESKNDTETKRMLRKKNKKDKRNFLDNHVQAKSLPKIAPVRKSSRQRKETILMEDSDSREEPFGSEDNSSDPEFTVNSQRKDVYNFCFEEKDVKKQSRSKKARTKLKQDESREEKYELEYSVKSRIETVPRNPILSVHKKKSGGVNQTTQEVVKIKERRLQNKEILEKKIATGKLNENYVRIDLKKKIYCRGKKTINFSKYKKQMWKNKKKALCGPDMDMGGCDGGLLTCFNCGQVGHFARACKNTKGDALLPLESVDEEECLYPTLEEAAKVAQENILAIRKSRQGCDEDSDRKTEDTGNVIELEGENDKSIGQFLQDVENDFYAGEDDDDLLTETIRVEEIVSKIDTKHYMDSTTFVTPYYKLEEDGSIIDTPEDVFDALKKFGHDTFRIGQERAIMRILSGKSTLVTLSTGSGKSLCYQLPAYLYAKREYCISLVISPLVSLMEDQITGIPSFLKAACLHTNQTRTKRNKVLEAISSGELNILLVSPEAVAAGEKSTGFGSLLRRLPPIAFACIDEAHCVSQWSHNFRPSYLMLCRILRERLGITTILGLTATATKLTANSIIDNFQIPDGSDGIISDIPLPNNLRLTVSKHSSVIEKDTALVKLLTSERFSNCKSIIIYCTRREECERIAMVLRSALSGNAGSTRKRKRGRVDVVAEVYHAGLPASRRGTIQKSFMSGELRIVVATIAFGMGINKSDIRAVIHYNMPSDIESYVQEVGRAGRDGLPAHCHLFLDLKGNDEDELKRHIYANSMDRHVIRKLLQKVFVPCSCKGTCPKHEVAFSMEETVLALDVREENISTLLCYLELHEKRYIQVLSPVYVSCKIISYGGPLQIRKAVKDCPPLAMALALYKDTIKHENVFEFPVVDVAAAMGWDSGICKHKLKHLEWSTESSESKRSKLNVEFSNLGFHVLAPGNLTESQLDEALDSIYQYVMDQEKSRSLQLHILHSILMNVAEDTYMSCLNEEITENEELLKSKIREYFKKPNPIEDIEDIEKKLVNEEQIINSIRQLIFMYKDNNFSGRAVARIFQGIQSPNYPAVIWGRCKFWRMFIKEDFNAIYKIATQEILRLCRRA